MIALAFELELFVFISHLQLAVVHGLVSRTWLALAVPPLPENIPRLLSFNTIFADSERSVCFPEMSVRRRVIVLASICVRPRRDLKWL